MNKLAMVAGLQATGAWRGSVGWDYCEGASGHEDAGKRVDEGGKCMGHGSRCKERGLVTRRSGNGNNMHQQHAGKQLATSDTTNDKGASLALTIATPSTTIVHGSNDPPARQRQ